MKRISSPVQKLSVLLIAVVVVLALAGLAQAQKRGDHSGGPGPNHEEMMNRVAGQLNLTDEQQEQMKQLHLQHREETESLREQMETAQARLDERIDAEQFDEEAIRAAAAEFSGFQTEMFVTRAEMQQELREILTPEQYEQMKEMRNRHHGMMRRHSGGSKDGHFRHGRNHPEPEDG